MAGGGKATQRAISKTIKAGRAAKRGNKEKALRAAGGAIKQASRTRGSLVLYWKFKLGSRATPD